MLETVKTDCDDKLFLLLVLVNDLAGPALLRLQVNSCGVVEGSGEAGFCISSPTVLDHIT